MDVERRLRLLEEEVRHLKSQLKRIPEDVQEKQFRLIKRDPADCKVGDFPNRAIQTYKDEKNSKRGLLYRIDGELFKLEGTKVT